MANALDSLHAQYEATADPADLFSLLDFATKYVRRICYRPCRDRSDDVAQDAMVTLWRNLDKFDGSLSSFTNFVRLNARAAINRHLRNLYSSPQETAGADEEEVEEVVDDRGDFESTTELYRAFGDDAPLLDLLLAGESLISAAAKLGISHKAARCMIDRARRRANIFH
jgi:RNA polymerase sigma factor (sigma-70 family)